MWPQVDVIKGEVYPLGYELRHINREECKNPELSIKEIVMVYADYKEVEYDKADVPLAVEYDTEFGLHTILFSKVRNLKYVNHGIKWIACITSDKDVENLSLMERIDRIGDGGFVPEEAFKKFLKICYAK